MSEHHLATRSTSPNRRIGRSLRTFLSDLRDAWRDPAIHAATPALQGYPISRARSAS